MTPYDPPVDSSQPEDDSLDAQKKTPEELKGYLEYDLGSEESDLPGLDDEIPEESRYRPGRNQDYQNDPYSAFSDLGKAEESPYGAASSLPRAPLNPAMKPKNYLVWTILTTIFCCWPLGVVSLVYSILTETAWSSGDQHSAYKNAILAKRWLYINLVISAVLGGAYVLFVLVMGAMN